MRFNWLTKAMINGQNELPSLYLTFTLIQALLRDVREDTGAEAAQCALGDDRVCARMAELCRFLREVCQAHRSELNQDRRRFEELNSQLPALQAELEAWSSLSARLEKLEQEQKMLESQQRATEKRRKRAAELEQTCQELRRQVFDLRGVNVDALEQQCAALRREVQERRAVTDRLSGEVSEAAEQVHRLRTNEKTFRRHLETLKKEKTAREADQASITTGIPALQAAILRLQEDIETRRAELERLKAERLQLQQQANTLRQQTEEQTAQLRTQERTILSDNQELETLRQTEEAQVSRLRDANQALSRQLQQIRAEHRARQTELDRLSTDIPNLQSDIDRMREEIQTQQSRCATLTTEREALRKKAEEERRQSDRAAAALESERLSLTAAVQSLRQRRQDAERTVQDLQAENDALSGQVDALQARQDGEGARLEELKAAIPALNAALNAQQSERRDLLEEQNRLRGSIEHLRQQNEEARRQLAGPMSDEQKQEKLRQSGLQAMIAMAKTEYQSALQHREKLEAEQKQLEQKLSRLKRTLQSREQAHAAARDQEGALEQQRRELEDKTAQIRDRLQHLQTRIGQLNAEELPVLRQSLQEYESLSAALTSERNRLEAQAQSAEHQVELLRTQTARQAERRRVLAAEYSDLTGRYDQNSAELRELRRQLEELRAQPDADMPDTIRRQRENQLKELKSARETCRKLELELRSGTAQLEKDRRRQEQLLQKREQLDALNESVREALEQLSNVNTQNHRMELNRTRRRLSLLESRQRELAAAIGRVGEVLGADAVAETADIADAVSQALRSANDALDRLADSLQKCEDTVNLEQE